MSDLHTLGVAQLSALLQNKDISAVELASRMLARLGGNRYNAFLSVDSEVTLAQAKAADARIAARDTSPLLGVPIAHKDIFVTADFPTTAGALRWLASRWLASLTTSSRKRKAMPSVALGA